MACLPYKAVTTVCDAQTLKASSKAVKSPSPKHICFMRQRVPPASYQVIIHSPCYGTLTMSWYTRLFRKARMVKAKGPEFKAKVLRVRRKDWGHTHRWSSSSVLP